MKYISMFYPSITKILNDHNWAISKQNFWIYKYELIIEAYSLYIKQTYLNILIKSHNISIVQVHDFNPLYQTIQYFLVNNRYFSEKINVNDIKENCCQNSYMQTGYRQIKLTNYDEFNFETEYQ